MDFKAFASPDSDYDVRFVYVRPGEDYLRLDEPRDVIEWQLDEVLDINGWDLKKALRQFARGNASINIVAVQDCTATCSLLPNQRNNATIIST